MKSDIGNLGRYRCDEVPFTKPPILGRGIAIGESVKKWQRKNWMCC